MDNYTLNKKKYNLIGSKFIKHYKKKLRKINKPQTKSTNNLINQPNIVQPNIVGGATIAVETSNITWYQTIYNYIIDFLKDNYGFLILILLILILLYVRYIEVLKRKEKIKKIKKKYVKEEDSDTSE